MIMPRLVNGERKVINPRPENAGKLLIRTLLLNQLMRKEMPDVYMIMRKSF